MAASKSTRRTGKARLAAAQKRASKKRTPAVKAAKDGAARPGSKMEKACLVMEREFVKNKADRATCIKALIDEAGLTKGGAPTYYQLIKTRILRDEA